MTALQSLSVNIFITFSTLCLFGDVAHSREPSAEDFDFSEIVITTGSRLQRTTLTSPTPVVSLGPDDLDMGGYTDVANILNRVPSFGIPDASPITTNTSADNIGLNLLNLRNLGSTRTLVLVNGRRHVPGLQGTNAVDMNAIPMGIVDRVEVITGGASAIYGSEAIAGVVNVITKQNFKGVEIDARSGLSSRSDGQQESFSITYGTELDSGRGNLILNASLQEQNAIKSKDRKISKVDKFTNADGTIRSPAGSSVNADSLLLYPTNTGGFNVVTRGNDGLYNQTATDEFRFNRVAHRQVLMPSERKLASGAFNFDISETLSFFSEAYFADSSFLAKSEPVVVGNFWTFGNGENQDLLNLPVSNPYIPAEVLNTLDPTATSITFFARPVHLGNRQHPTNRDSFRWMTGFSGQTLANWEWNAYAQYGRTHTDLETRNLVNLRRFVEAINAEVGPDGEIRCISEAARVEGCVPYNIFGADAASQQALDYVSAKAHYDIAITQKVAAASISGSPYTLPTGDVLLATGLEYREEFSSFDVDPLTEDAMLSYGWSPDIKGRYDVSEAFAEVSVPVVNELGFIKMANVDLAARLAEYDTIGSSFSWKAGSSAELAGDIRLRSAYATATRAPNISELFLPQTSFGGRVVDPCDGGGNVAGLTASAAATRIANCTALGIDASFQVDQLSLESVTGVTGGNPNLDEETAKTLTFGFVYTPMQLPGFWAAVDYWRIAIEDSIGSVSRQITVDQCVDQPSINNEFCDDVRRDPVTHQIRTVDAFLQNLAEEKVAGIDFELKHRFDPDLTDKTETFEFVLLGTYLIDDEFRQFSGSELQRRIDDIGRPRWKAQSRLSYYFGPWGVNLAMRYIGKAYKIRDVDTSANKIDPATYTDAHFSYHVNNKVFAYLGVRNLLDKNAPIITSPVTEQDGSTQTVPEVYDPIGRSFYLGVTLNL